MFLTEDNALLYGLMLALVAVTALAVWCWRPWLRAGKGADCSKPGYTEADDAAETQPEDEESDDAAETQPEEIDADVPMVSVIVYTEQDAEEIRRCVETLARQDYPRKEIVVVTRGNASGRELLAASLSDMEGVYVTFIPSEAHNVSERKLAITVGLKAAHGDIVLTTTSNIRPGSDRWLAEMAAPFADAETELVLGYSHLDFAEMRGPWRWYRQYDSVMTAGQWIGYALNGKPYRGDGYNLAFRRSTFFAHKGYARNMFLHYGDDDLFVNEIATSRNTAVVMNADTVLTTEWGENANRMWTLRKSRYQFTARWLPSKPFLSYSLLSWCNWLALALAVTVGLLAGCNWVWIAAPAVCWLALTGFQIHAYRRLAHSLCAVRLWTAVPLFMLAHPLCNAWFRMTHYRLRKVNFTWRR